MCTGISEPFEVSSTEDRLTLEPSEQPSGSSTSPGKSSTATTDIFADFTGLDVGKLSRHFSNDLSIDWLKRYLPGSPANERKKDS